MNICIDAKLIKQVKEISAFKNSSEAIAKALKYNIKSHKKGKIRKTAVAFGKK